jgi:hypothetical protein
MTPEALDALSYELNTQPVLDAYASHTKTQKVS